MPGEVYLGHVTILFLASKGITTDCQSGCLSLHTHQLCDNFLYQAQDIFIFVISAYDHSNQGKKEF